MEAKQVKGLMEAYASVYTNISESHFKVGDEVVCKASGMEGEIVKVDPEGKGKYYTVKREDGKTMKYAPDELKLDKEEEKGEKEEEGASKEKEGEFHDKLDKMVHKTFGKRPEEKKMKEEVELDEDSAALSAAARRRAQEMGAKRRRTPAYRAGGNRGTGRNERAAYNLSNTQRSAAANPDTQRTRSRRPSTEDTGMHQGDYDRYNRKDPKKNPKHEANKETSTESYDLFDHILEHLVAEGYADTNQAALAIMANMSEEWREEIIEAAADQSNKQIEKGVKTTYKAGNVLDNQHQGRSKGLNKLPAGERKAKTERMRGRLKSRRDDLFGERNRREDEARAEMKKKYGL